ncbi:alpha-1,3-mannosyl-glycoprotein 4-beta-N-acetylglucosaminyltransferase B-like [Gigantopelta aegis]|uniref:alpha-1,3-mannosyl-glycoprotein 4-beta-N-acetylglucosaminyltransferase B-like n=1 Tax=Gigantopelta aegis TaxID=1735272 RepID=UPI001B88D84D|nr:alpha-1,3-mannosyl-glycoprotein 4-beta-N-acetylglucosaminyltransferase B-like [Gigantopelta aegis]
MRMRVRLRNVLLLTAVLCFSPLLWLSLFSQNDHDEYEAILEQRFAELRDRLHYAESLSRQRENDLFILRNHFSYLVSTMHTNGTVQLNRTLEDMLLATKTNMSGFVGTIHLPSIFTHLPHLSGHPESMRPAFKMSKNRYGVSIVMGVPTIKREKISYLTETLRSLIDELNAEEKEDCLIVLFIAEPWDLNYVKDLGNKVHSLFRDHIQSGLLEVIAPPAGFYPDLEHLKESFGDTKTRVRWRTKQNLDYSFLMLHARSRGVYYVQLEDDVIAKPGYLSIMKSFAHQQKIDDWMLLEFSALGFIGKMFKSADLPYVVEFFLMFYADKPIDWLLDHLLMVKVCNPEKDLKHCGRMKLAVRRRFKPSLFQHVGVTSSLKGKVQKLKDKDFGKLGLFRAHVNPSATLSTSLHTYKKYQLFKAYVGETFFWATNPSEGDIIDFKFTPPVNVEKFLFRSGNIDHMDDRLYDATVEILPAQQPKGPIDLSDLNLFAGQKQPKENGYYIIGLFNDKGFVESTVPETLGKIDVLRIHFHSKSENWVILSEILIKERKA